MTEILIFGVVAMAAMFSWRKIFGSKPMRTPDHKTRAELTEMKEYFQKVDDWLQEGQRFRGSHIKLETVARATHLTEKQVSQAVNTVSQQNFSSYINKLRINEAKNLLLNPDYGHYTIEAFAEMVGFANKVSFYKAFKRVYGLSPTEWKKAQNHQS
ncbi:helix-turn-helix domain-containing protein [Marinoscillum sp.]|uniref:helix-turn-helix domain-containing protein n=1 Tax=Marinoscillum sp. TaxID=2024838 RepID=UPI003BAAC78C